MNRIVLSLIILLIVAGCKEAEVKEFPFEKEPVQIFRIDASKDTIITGVKGTQLYIQANSLLDSTGKAIEGNAELNLTEFYTLQDFLKNGLTTQTLSNKVLQSFGMLHMEAYQNSKRLKVDFKKPYFIKFNSSTLPSSSAARNLFYGVSTSDGVKWQESDSITIDPIIQITQKIEQLQYGAERITERQDTIGFITSFYKKGVKMKSEIVSIPLRENSLTPPASDSTSFFYEFDFLIASKFGYINDDAFLKGETIDFTVNLPSANFSCDIIINDINSVLSPIEINGSKALFKVPRDMKISVFAIQQTEENVWLFDFKASNSSAKQITLSPERSSKEEIIKQLSSLE